MYRVYATSPENAYIVGHNDQAFGKMFHFDGTGWTDVRLNQSQGGTISPPIGSLNAIHGFGPSDIYAVGQRYGNPPTSSDSSVVIHFDGVQWREQNIHPQRTHRLQSLWGASPTDIWAAGTNTLVHYDGVQWSHFPIEIPGQGIQFLSIAGFRTSEVYAVGRMQDATGNNDTAAYYLYRFDGTSWTVADSSMQILGNPPHKFGGFLNVVDGRLFSVGQGVFERQSAGWVRLYSVVWPLVSLAGTHQTSLFATGTNSQIWHFNGTDWYRYPQFQGSDVDFLSLWANGETIFVVGNDGARTFVAQGR